MKKIFTLAAVGIALAAQAEIADFEFSYADFSAPMQVTGVGRLVDYDVAIKIDNPSLVGSQILGVSVDIPSTGGKCAPEASAWITDELQIIKEVNLPNITSTSGTIKNIGTEDNPHLVLDIDFEEPYTLTEEPVYVGYSVLVTELKNWTQVFPVVTYANDNPAGGLYIHCTKGASGTGYKYLQWTDLAESKMAVSGMRVKMRGDRKQNSVDVTLPYDKIYSLCGEEMTMNVTLSNTGLTEVSNVTYDISDESGKSLGSGDVVLASPLKNEFGSSAIIPVTFTAPAEEGSFDLSFAITKVNGAANEEQQGVKMVENVVRAYYPKHRPLVEEHTGLWCGYCPQAYVAVAEARDQIGEDFICLAYHLDDAMQGVSAAYLPNSGGAPSVRIDRSAYVHNYSTLDEDWWNQARVPAVADIDVKIYWTDDTRTALRAESNLKFIEGYDDVDYRLSYVMVEDEMSDPDWKQRNFFSDNDYEGKYWSLFVGKGWDVTGIIYDDVVVSSPNPKGIEGSVPGNIEADIEYEHVKELYLDDARNAYSASVHFDKYIIKDPDKLRIVAVLIDAKTGKVLNSCTSGYSGQAPIYDPATSGIGEISSNNPESAVIATEYYSLDGVRLTQKPEKGAFIEVERHDDGSVKTAKRLQ